MKPGAGKSKGSSFERKTAQELSLWLTNKQSRKELIRSVLSGGWDKKSPDLNQVGDLAPNGPYGAGFRVRFAVECKHHKGTTVDFWKLFTGQSMIITWWEKLVKECRPFKLEPMLIFKGNNRPTLVGLRPAFTHVLDTKLIVCATPYLVLSRFDSLIEKVKPEQLYAIADELAHT